MVFVVELCSSTSTCVGGCGQIGCCGGLNPPTGCLCPATSSHPRGCCRCMAHRSLHHHRSTSQAAEATQEEWRPLGGKNHQAAPPGDGCHGHVQSRLPTPAALIISALTSRPAAWPRPVCTSLTVPAWHGFSSDRRMTALMRPPSHIRRSPTSVLDRTCAPHVWWSASSQLEYNCILRRACLHLYWGMDLKEGAERDWGREVGLHRATSALPGLRAACKCLHSRGLVMRACELGWQWSGSLKGAGAEGDAEGAMLVGKRRGCVCKRLLPPCHPASPQRLRCH